MGFEDSQMGTLADRDLCDKAIVVPDRFLIYLSDWKKDV